MRRRTLVGTAAFLPAAPALLKAQTAPIRGRLVLYTSQLEPDAAGTVRAFNAVHPNVQVEWIRAGTNALIPRMRAEFAAGAPGPDVLLIADSLTMEGLKRENRLRHSPEIDIAGTTPDAHDPARYYFGTKLITTGIVMNIRAPFVPARWTDLLRPEARGQVAMPTLTISAAAEIHVQTIVQNPALGWGYLQALAERGLQPRGGNGAVMQTVAGGERAYGMIVDFLPIREAARGAPVRFIFPEEGVSAITEPAAILSTARNVPAAIAFVNFLLSRPGQDFAVSQGYLAADPASPSPANFPPRSAIRLMPYDAARAATESAEIRRRFTALVGA